MINCTDFLKNDLFFCEHLTISEKCKKEIIDTFFIRRTNAKGLEKFIKAEAFIQEQEGRARTFLVRDSRTNEIACYFTLKAGLISADEEIEENGVSFNSISGIELSNFAVNDAYKEKHPEVNHIGTIVFSCFIYKLALQISRCMGAFFLYIFALPCDPLIHHYESLNFTRLPEDEDINVFRFSTPRYNKNCVFMCQKLVDKN